jgi:hypothetical protein
MMDNGTRSNRMPLCTAFDLIQRGESFVYALVTRDGAVKIGVSRNLYRRKTHMALGGFDHFLAFAPGEYADEQNIHNAMQDDVRIPGMREYYYPLHEHILPPVNRLRDAMSLPHLNRRELPRTGVWANRLPVAQHISWPRPKPWLA